MPWETATKSNALLASTRATDDDALRRTIRGDVNVKQSSFSLLPAQSDENGNLVVVSELGRQLTADERTGGEEWVSNQRARMHKFKRELEKAKQPSPKISIDDAYERQCILGQGGFGMVILSKKLTDPEKGTFVALKGG